jgi:4'-phosphopantetheinyl transferase
MRERAGAPATSGAKRGHHDERQHAVMTELWLVDLDRAAPALEVLEHETPRLGPDDRARAMRGADAHERRHRLAAYMALRVLLERACGPAIRGRKLLRGPSGKPHLGPDAPAFSLAHIDGLALIAMAPAGAVGVDLERPRRLHVSSRRRDEILAVGVGLGGPLGPRTSHDPHEEEALLRAWCRLEAFAKARGEGLSHLLGELGLREAGGRQLGGGQILAAARRLAGRAGLEAADLKLPHGLYGAVAAASLSQPPRLRRFPVGLEAIRALLPTRG